MLLDWIESRDSALLRRLLALGFILLTPVMVAIAIILGAFGYAADAIFGIGRFFKEIVLDFYELFTDALPEALSDVFYVLRTGEANA